MKKISKICLIVLAVASIISICSNVKATTGSLYNKYKDGDFSGYNGSVDDLVQALKNERDQLITQGFLRRRRIKKI